MAVEINGSTIPTPSAVTPPKLTKKWRGGAREKASGKVTFDWIDANLKREWTLSWTNINSSALTQLETAYNALAAATATGVTYKDVGGTTYYVTLSPEKFEMEDEQVLTGGGIRHNVTLTLRQV